MVICIVLCFKSIITHIYMTLCCTWYLVILLLENIIGQLYILYFLSQLFIAR